MLLLLLLLPGYITVKGKIYFCSRSDSQKSYVEDHSSDIEMTIAETNVNVNLEISPLSDFPESVSLVAKGRILGEFGRIFTEEKIQVELEVSIKYLVGNAVKAVVMEETVPSTKLTGK